MDVPKVKLTTSIRKKYMQRTFLIACIFVLFQLSGFISNLFQSDQSTPLSTTFTQASVPITYLANGYDKEENQFIFAFYIPTDKTNPLVSFELFAKADKITSDYLPAKTTKVYEDFFIVRVQLPTKWEKISYEIFPVEEGVEPSLAATDKFELYAEGLPAKTLTIQDGKVAYLKSKIKLAEDENEAYETKIESLERDIEKLNSANSDLENSYEQLAEADKPAVQEKINSNTTTKEQKLSEITEVEEDIAANEERIFSFERLLDDET